MEQLIIFIIITIVGSLYNKFKNKEQQQMPPFDKDAKAQPTEVNTEERKSKRPTVTAQTFEDFARKFLDDFQDDQPQKKPFEKPDKPPITEAAEVAPSYVAAPVVVPPVETLPTSTMSERQNIERRVAERTGRSAMKQVNSFKMPKSKRAIVDAIVMAEILGPPKAKQR